MKIAILGATMVVAAAAATFSNQASASDPVAGMIIGGGIGAAIGGPPGAAVGAILGAVIGDAHHYDHRRGYYDRHRYYDRGYDPRYYDRGYYDPAPARHYEPGYAPRVYRASPRYYNEPRYSRGYDRRYEGRRYDDRRYDDRRYDDRRYDRRDERRACRATAWNPNARYWPGQRVWRNGEVYVATGLSASVWNVNSPPEWTPNYWAPARCSPRDDGHAGYGRRGDWR